MVYKDMIPVYAFLIKAKLRTMETLLEQYKIPVAEYLANEVESDQV